MQHKNICIEAFRFIFMVILCLWHIEGMIHIQHHGYLVVEFFFMLSGVFLYHSLMKRPDVGAIDFTIRKLKRFWIEYAIVFLPTFLLLSRGTIVNLGYDQVLNFILTGISELFLVQNIGIFPDGVNFAAWYLSVLIWGGALLYYSLKHYRQLTIGVLIPLVCLVFYTYTFSMQNDKPLEYWGAVNGFYLPLWRGISGMGLGVLIGYLLREKKSLIDHYPRLVSWCSVLSLIAILALMFCNGQHDACILLFAPPFILGCMHEESWLHKRFTSRWWLFLGGLTYEMLIVHLLVRGFFIYFRIYEQIPALLLVVAYLSIVMLCSYLLKKIGTSIRVRLSWD